MLPGIVGQVVAVNRLTGRWPFALRAGFCMAAPVVAGWAAGDVAAGLTATIGGFTALYGSGRPYAYRALELAVVAVSLAVAVTLGDWAASTHPWLGVAVTSAIAAVAVLVCNTLAVGPPGAYMFALACAAGVGISVEHESPWHLGVLVLCGGAFSWLVHMSGALVRFRGPERAAVAAAERAVHRLAEDVGTAAENRSVDAAARALHHSWVVLVTFQPIRPERSAALQRLRATNHRLHATFAGLVSGTTGPHSERGPRTDEIPLGRPGGVALLRSALAGSHPLRVAVQVGVAAVVAGSLATALGVDRGYWAIAAAVLVLHNGFDRSRTVVRGLQRLLGTLAGLGLAGGILGLHPHGPWLAALLFVLQFSIEMLVVRNYALATVVITPTALTIASGGRPIGDLGELLLTRGVDTLIGCAVAFAVLLLGGHRYEATRIRTALADALDALALLVPHLAAGEVTSASAREARRDAQTRAMALLVAYDAAVQSGSRASRAAERLWPAVAACERLTYRTLAACWHVQHPGSRSPVDPADGERLHADLADLATAARTGAPPVADGAVAAFAADEIVEARQVLSARA